MWCAKCDESQRCESLPTLVRAQLVQRFEVGCEAGPAQHAPHVGGARVVGGHHHAAVQRHRQRPAAGARRRMLSPRPAISRHVSLFPAPCCRPAPPTATCADSRAYDLHQSSCPLHLHHSADVQLHTQQAAECMAGGLPSLCLPVLPADSEAAATVFERFASSSCRASDPAACAAAAQQQLDWPECSPHGRADFGDQLTGAGASGQVPHPDIARRVACSRLGLGIRVVFGVSDREQHTSCGTRC